MIPEKCPGCSAGREDFVADYYEAVRQGIILITEDEYEYDGVYQAYDDGSTGDECIRCTNCWSEVVRFGHFELLSEEEYAWLTEKRSATKEVSA